MGGSGEWSELKPPFLATALMSLQDKRTKYATTERERRWKADAAEEEIYTATRYVEHLVPSGPAGCLSRFTRPYTPPINPLPLPLPHPLFPSARGRQFARTV